MHKCYRRNLRLGPSKMQYFTFEPDAEAGRVYPQVSTATLVGSMIPADDWPTKDAIRSLAPKLESGAVVTDLLSEAATCAYGFLISHKLREYLASFTLMDHRLYDCPVVGEGAELKGYAWLHLFDSEPSNALDYTSSSFVEEGCFDEIGPIKIKSLAHYHELKSKDTEASFGVTLSEIRFKAGSPKYDMFAVHPFTSDVLVSEKLRDGLLKLGLTGVEFNEGPEVAFAT